MMTENTATKPFTGWHALAWIGGFFGLMFAVNGIFLYHAITSFPGEDTPKSYLQGLNYNAVLAERSAQAEKGWRAEIGLDGNAFVFRLRDKEGYAVGGHEVSSSFRHQTTTREDTELALTPYDAGEYRTDIGVLGSGVWDVIVTARWPGEEKADFVARKTIIVR